MKNKICTGCKVDQPLENFHRNRSGKDGRSYRCKTCCTKYAKAVYLANREKHRAYIKAYFSSPRGKEVKRAERRRYMERWPQRHEAHWKLNYALMMGRVVRQPCQVCGDPKVHGHHYDYSKPYDVVWLCEYHHRQIEGRIADPNETKFTLQQKETK